MHERPGRQPLSIPVGNTPEAFVEAHLDKDNSLRDPVMFRLKRQSVPFTYDQTMYVNEGAADLWDLQAPFGYRSGIATALHMPGGMHFLMGVDRNSALPSND